MRPTRLVPFAALALGGALIGCSSPPDEGLLDTAGVWSETEQFDVEEVVRFTTESYDLEGTGTTIRDIYDDLLPTDNGEILYADGDEYGDSGCDAGSTRELPVEVEGIVTLHPRWYMKLSGCNRADEKYYGNYFIEDDSGGIFVVGDSKVAHFDVGDRVRMRVRAVRTNFEFDMVYAHDIVEVSRERRAIKYAMVPEGGLTSADVGKVHRVRGEMVAEPSTFGEFQVRTEDGDLVDLRLDSELNRRRQYPTPGSTICATGPVQNSFGIAIVLMKIGQFHTVEGDEPCIDEPQAD